MDQKSNDKRSSLEIRRCIKTIDDSIAQLEMARASLVALLPKTKGKMENCTIQLPDGRVMDLRGKIVSKKQK